MLSNGKIAKRQANSSRMVFGAVSRILVSIGYFSLNSRCNGMTTTRISRATTIASADAVPILDSVKPSW